MYIYREETYEKMSRRAANIISAQVIQKPDSVLGLATGSSPLGPRACDRLHSARNVCGACEALQRTSYLLPRRKDRES